MSTSKPLIIVVVGATASGKSSVAHEICSHFNGALVNADVMQCYKGIPIATNKPSLSEMEEFHYHTIDFVPHSINYTVNQWIIDADNAIHSILNNNQIPVICGGTSYYIDALLFRHSSQQQNNIEEFEFEDNNQNHLIQKQQIDLNVSNEKLHDLLKTVDPKMAERLHPNDIQRIRNALIFYNENGKLLSEELINSTIESPYNAVIVWVDANKKILDERAEKRVDEMVKLGMVKENLDFIEANKEDFEKLEWKWGICMAIGLREFIEAKQLNLSIDQAIENVKTHTKQYIRRQIRWIQNRFIKQRELNLIHYVHNGKSTENIEQIFPEIKKQLQSPQIHSTKCLEDINFIEWKKYYCDVCKRTLNGKKEWDVHSTSSKHKAALKKQKKIEKGEIYLPKRSVNVKPSEESCCNTKENSE
ncbi:tRNA isopentenyltransferase [Entamoeba marina]